MYRLLIVDDEPFITDGLYRTFCNFTELSFDVYRAYYAKAALNLLDQYRMDIVITDINMPGISGLDMLKEIKNRWPECRTIILSGYNDFYYAQTALQYGASHYILKSDGDDLLIDAVKSCIKEIDLQLQTTNWKCQVEASLKKALPLLQQNLLLQLLSEPEPDTEQLRHQFSELQIPLNPDRSFFLTAVRIDHVTEEMNSSYSSYSAAVYSIFRNLTDGRIISSSIVLENPRFTVWLLQPTESTAPHFTEKYINGLLESAQQYCLYTLKTSISFLVEPKPITLGELHRCYQKMLFILTYKLNSTEEMVLSDTSFYEPSDQPESDYDQLLPNFPRLSLYLEQQNRGEFLKLFDKLLSLMTEGEKAEMQVLIYHQLCALLLSTVMRFHQLQPFLEKFHSISVFTVPYSQWDVSLYKTLSEIAGWIFDFSSMESQQRYHQMISIIHRYIDSHLTDDISLSALAEQVYLNPVYLSRVYKQITGQNLSKYIADCRTQKAKDYLRNSSFKINEIAYSVGYESPAHFSRMFKKAAGMSPQEYRDQKTGIPD